MTDTLLQFEYLLTISEPWDRYSKIALVFLGRRVYRGYNYHIFMDQDQNAYGLSPRILGEQIEDILKMGRLVVHILFFGQGEEPPDDLDRRYGMGGLEITRRIDK